MSVNSEICVNYYLYIEKGDKTMYYTSKAKINCIGDYIKEVVSLRQASGTTKEYYQWYRGHSDETWSLVPKVQREFQGTEEALFRRERYFTNDFQARASIFKFKKPKLDDYSSWLTLMQHYGLPTRLLDWSRSPLVALYFAVSDRNYLEKDACVWVITPGKLNELEKLEKATYVDDKKYENTFIYNMEHKTISTMVFTAFKRWELSGNEDAITPEDMKFNHRFETLRGKIAACYPTEADGRIYNQYGVFTVHNSMRKLVEICEESTLTKIIIPNEKKKQILKELSICGITESYIYPDLEHLSEELKELQGYNMKK